MPRHSWTGKGRRHRGRGVTPLPLWPIRRWPLRENGSQRNRVWPDGSLRGRAEYFAAANIGKEARTADAETTPLRQPEHYRYDFNLPDITEVWRRGSVIASWLLDLTAGALFKAPDLEIFRAMLRIPAKGDGRSQRPSTKACRLP